MPSLIRRLLDQFSDWVGDRDLKLAIQAKLRAGGYAVHTARIRDVRLRAIERPGWIQVYSFWVETRDRDGRAVVLYGVSRHDGRRSGTLVELAQDAATRDARLREWSADLAVR